MVREGVGLELVKMEVVGGRGEGRGGERGGKGEEDEEVGGGVVIGDRRTSCCGCFFPALLFPFLLLPSSRSSRPQHTHPQLPLFTHLHPHLEGGEGKRKEKRGGNNNIADIMELVDKREGESGGRGGEKGGGRGERRAFEEGRGKSNFFF